MSAPVFRRYAGSLQLRIDTFADLRTAMALPEARWVALACPVQGLSADPKLLAYLDTDGNGRIRAEELRAATRLLDSLLTDTSGVDAGSDTLVLAHLSDAGDGLALAARMILDALAAPDRDRISIAQVRQSEEALKAASATGDGIVAPTSVKDPALRALADRIATTLPTKKNRAGEDGFDLDTLAAFRKRRAEGLALLDRRAAVDVLGDDGFSKAQAVLALAPRLDEWFLQCRLVATQPDAAEALRLKATQLEALLGDPEALAKHLTSLPIAPPVANGRLAWSMLHRGPSFEALVALKKDVCDPVLGESDALTEEAWRGLVARARALVDWHTETQADPVRALGEALRTIDPSALDALEELCRTDLARKAHLEAVSDLERLLLYQRWILTFANNFVSMPDLYDPTRHAIFEAGELVLAGRRFSFAVRVPDRAAHVALADQSSMCLAYVRVESGRAGEAPYEVAVPVTAGTSAGIMTGRRGIFRDREGREFDAVVVHVVRQPVSLWEAITQPFTRIGRFVTGKLEGLAGEGDKALNENLEQSWKKAEAAAKAPAAVDGPAAPAAATPAAPAGSGLGGMAGIVAAGGVAFAAIGSSLAFIVGQIRELSLFELLRGALLLVAAIALPVGLLAWLKLRRRNLAVVLEGSGWALNESLFLTTTLGELFTRRPALPTGSRIEVADVVTDLRALITDAPDPDVVARVERRRRLAVAAGLLLVALGAAAWWFFVRAAPVVVAGQ